MEYLPLFAQIRDKPVLVVGGGDVAARKIELLRRAGARVQVVSRQLCEELAELHAEQQIAWLATDYQASQLERVFLVIAATDDGELNGQVFQDARARKRAV